MLRNASKPFQIVIFCLNIQQLNHSTARLETKQKQNEFKIELDSLSKPKSMQEQQWLRQIVENNKDLTWNEISNEMNKIFPHKCRTGKQYRERYVNYVQFEESSAKNNSWSLQEQRELFKCYREIGTKWTIIARIVPSKSENSLKNKFYGALRKTLRKINRIGKQNIKKFNKFIRYESLIRIMDAAQGGDDLPSQIKINSIDIKRKILNMAQKCESEFQIDEVSEVIKKIHQFNIATRCYSSKKWKRSGFLNCEVKQQYIEDESNSMQKSSKTCENTQKESSRAMNIGEQLQSKRSLEKENIKIQVCQKQKNKLQMQQEKLIKDNGLLESEASQSSKKSLNDDLEFELCGILHQNYEPQYFNYFEE